MSPLHIPSQLSLDDMGSACSASMPCSTEASNQVLATEPCWEDSWTTPHSEILASGNTHLDTTGQHQALTEGSLRYIADYLTPSSTSSDESSSAQATPSSALQFAPNTSYAGTASSKQEATTSFDDLDGRTLAAVTLQTYALMSGEGPFAPQIGSSSTLAVAEPPLMQQLQALDPITHLPHGSSTQQELDVSTSAPLYPFFKHRQQDWRSPCNDSVARSSGSILDRIIGSSTSSHSHIRGYQASAEVQSTRSQFRKPHEQTPAPTDPIVLASRLSYRPIPLSEVATAYANAHALSLALTGRGSLTSSHDSYLGLYPSGRRVSLVESAWASPEARSPACQHFSSSSAVSTSEPCSSTWQRSGAQHSSDCSAPIADGGQSDHSDEDDDGSAIVTSQRLAETMNLQTETSGSPTSSAISKVRAGLAPPDSTEKKRGYSSYEREKEQREYEYLTAIVLPAEVDEGALPYTTKTDQDPRRVPARQEFEGPEDTRAVAQEPKLGSSDLYTPKFVKGHKNNRQGWCDCGKWLGMKSSVYNYHASICHGVSCRTGRPFAAPTQIRWCKLLRMVDARCHNCGEWVNIMRKMMRHRTWKNWFVHASHCHHKALKPKTSTLETQPAAVESVDEDTSEGEEQPAQKRSSASPNLKPSTRLKRSRNK